MEMTPQTTFELCFLYVFTSSLEDLFLVTFFCFHLSGLPCFNDISYLEKQSFLFLLSFFLFAAQTLLNSTMVNLVESPGIA